MDFRSVDGSGNNLADPTVNAAGSDFIRIGEAHYADGISVPLGGPNPRTISNLVVGEGDAVVANDQGLSGMMYAWGQFIDHDLTRSTGDGVNSIAITVPNGDPIYADGTFIPLTRAVQDPSSGAGTGTPAIAINRNSGWLDGSMVYGSDSVTAAALRLADGHMATSAGNNLPLVNGMSFAGDVRVMENPSLTALQTIFVREHNYQVDRLAAADPSLTGEQLYQMARAIVTAEIARITYEEFLPKLLGADAVPDYAGYDPTVDATLSVEFTGAAYRWGHSTVSAETERKDEQGNVTGPALTLRDTFFLTPAAFSSDGGADGFLRHLGSDQSQAMDARIVEDLRSFLFDPPVGQDLAAINIQRGRDLGLGTLNQTRVSLGLEAYTDFAQITSDAGTLAGLRTAYATVDEIDLWTGGLSEQAKGASFLGETFSRIVGDQFVALRDGDRFWYQNQGFDAATLSAIEHTSLSDIILRTTDTQYLQGDIFSYYERHAPGVAPEDPDSPQLVVGSAANETLVGGDQGDILAGNGGDDAMAGGAGDDLYHVDGQGGVVYEANGGGHDTVIASGSYYLYAEVEALTLKAGAGDIFGVGNALDNVITGNEGNNLLLGGDGDDLIRGGAGNDTLYGEAGDDTLEASGGVDALAGGAGDDRYYVNGMQHLIFEDIGGGEDLVYAEVGAGAANAYYLYANLEGLRLTGTADSWGVGNELGNFLAGNAGANWLLGGEGNDTLNGGAGNDVLFGGAGADTFVIRPGTGAELVADFTPGEDVILLDEVPGLASFADVLAAMREVDGVTAIDLGGDDLLVIGGVANASLSASDFAFA
ncbi:peroxidase family protein [Paeniroseomonas aquatica]|uniref:Peroxidase family protein n=2 Tax=Paeniroseomonas aquatica TaxID=373043 RepID=A0ABT8AC68_9PROT|nr:peroxidase family protein [Paeniroseomonas aquatica]MDN3567330.1 peroxidase family protein [Paeniroseomonas aquatica]